MRKCRPCLSLCGSLAFVRDRITLNVWDEAISDRQAFPPGNDILERAHKTPFGSRSLNFAASAFEEPTQVLWWTVSTSRGEERHDAIRLALDRDKEST